MSGQRQLGRGGSRHHRRAPVRNEAKTDGPTRREWDIAFGLYVFTEARPDASLSWLCVNGYTDMQFLRNQLEIRYLSEEVDSLVEIQDPLMNWRQLYRTIVIQLTEYQLMVWVQTQNTTTGVAPSYSKVFAMYCQMRLDLGCPEEKYEAYHSQKKWVQRWMVKWSAARSQLQTHVAASADEVANKAHKNAKVAYQNAYF